MGCGLIRGGGLVSADVLSHLALRLNGTLEELGVLEYRWAYIYRPAGYSSRAEPKLGLGLGTPGVLDTLGVPEEPGALEELSPSRLAGLSAKLAGGDRPLASFSISMVGSLYRFRRSQAKSLLKSPVFHRVRKGALALYLRNFFYRRADYLE